MIKHTITLIFCFVSTSIFANQTIAIDFDYDGEGNALMAGQVITDQYSNLGVEIDAHNNVWWHPDKAIIFDTTNPTGNDWDLQTAGYGTNNNTVLGNALIIAEDAWDWNGDGLVDDPDDEYHGGYIDFFYTIDQMTAEITLLDIQQSDVSIEIFKDGNLVDSAYAANLGDNSVQTLNLFDSGDTFDQLRVNFMSGGAITNLVTLQTPEPSTYFVLMSFLAFGIALHRRKTLQLEKLGH